MLFQHLLKYFIFMKLPVWPLTVLDLLLWYFSSMTSVLVSSIKARPLPRRLPPRSARIPTSSTEKLIVDELIFSVVPGRADRPPPKLDTFGEATNPPEALLGKF